MCIQGQTLTRVREARPPIGHSLPYDPLCCDVNRFASNVVKPGEGVVYELYNFNPGFKAVS